MDEAFRKNSEKQDRFPINPTFSRYVGDAIGEGNKEMHILILPYLSPILMCYKLGSHSQPIRNIAYSDVLKIFKLEKQYSASKNEFSP